MRDEGPVHEVTISQGFYLGKYEVTQGAVGGWRWVRVPGKVRGNVRSDSDYPAVYVSWEDAQKFIRRLNASEGSECVSFADRGRVGVCVSGWDNDALVFW